MTKPRRLPLPMPREGAFTPGRFLICADPTCDAPMDQLLTVEERYDRVFQVVLGEQHCGGCGCVMIYARKVEAGDLPLPTAYNAANQAVLFALSHLDEARERAHRKHYVHVLGEEPPDNYGKPGYPHQLHNDTAEVAGHFYTVDQEDRSELEWP